MFVQRLLRIRQRAKLLFFRQFQALRTQSPPTGLAFCNPKSHSTIMAILVPVFQDCATAFTWLKAKEARVTNLQETQVHKQQTQSQEQQQQQTQPQEQRQQEQQEQEHQRQTQPQEQRQQVEEEQSRQQENNQMKSTETPGNEQETKMEGNHWPPVGVTPGMFLLFTAAMIVILLYTFFGIDQEGIDELLSYIRWGGDQHKLDALKKIRLYLLYDEFGIKLSNQLVALNAVGAVLDACCSTNRDVREEALHVLCLLSATSDTLRQQIIAENGVQILRNHVDIEQIDALFTIANISRHEAGAKQIFEDEIILKDLSDALYLSLFRKNVKYKRYIQRAVIITLYHLLQYERTPSKYTEHIPMSRLQQLFLAQGWTHDPIVEWYLLNVLKSLAEIFPEDFQQVRKILENVDLTMQSKLEIQLLVLRSISVVAAASLWAPVKIRWDAWNFRPLTADQKKWIFQREIRAPFVSLLFVVVALTAKKFASELGDRWERNRSKKSSNATFEQLNPSSWTRDAQIKVLTALYALFLSTVVYYGLKYSPYSFVPTFAAYAFSISEWRPPYRLRIRNRLRQSLRQILGIPEPKEDDEDEMKQEKFVPLQTQKEEENEKRQREELRRRKASKRFGFW
jgi:hypothetical protein